jgi:hypothetical protein
LKTLQQGLKEWAKRNNMKSPREKHKKENTTMQRKPEKLTNRDLRELMGTNMRTHRRGKGGSIRQR